MALLLHGNAHSSKLLLRRSVCRCKQPRWQVAIVCETQTHKQRELKVPSHAPPLLTRQYSRTRDWPVTVKDLEPAIAANLPVFYLHPQEQFFPCSVPWFLERCQVAVLRKGWRRRLIQVVQDFGQVTGDALRATQQEFAKDPDARHRLLMLRLQPDAQQGQKDELNKVPIYVHAKEVLTPDGKREAIELNYMTFLAYNGWYKLFDRIYLGKIGAHDADWEHVTVRLSADAEKVQGIYYSAHRHRDGVWKSGGDMPRSAEGRPLSYVALNGHGSYPIAAWIPRIFFAFNDQTSDQGPQWDSRRCVVVTPQGKLPSVTSRGHSLTGSSVESGHVSGQAPGDIVVEQQPCPWLDYHGRWGSTVEAPALQEWFAKAEHPISRTWLQQVLLPLAPGVESIWEPLKEEFEESRDKVEQRYRDVMEDAEEQVDKVQRDAQRNMELMQQQVKQLSRDADQRIRDRLKKLVSHAHDHDKLNK